MAVWRALAQPARYGALLAGALPVLAFPAPNLEFLGWIGLVPGLLLMRAAPSAREGAVRGWWFGTGYLLAAMYWLLPNLGPAVPLIAIALGCLWTAVGLAARALLRPPVSWRRALAALAVVPSAWLLTEWIRSWQALGGPWAVLGSSQWQHPAILALAAAGGVWLVTIALVAANTGIVIALVARGLPRLLGLAAALAAAGAGPAIFALSTPPAAARHVTVALVQPGILNGAAQRVTADEQLTTGTAARRADLIVWGESSVGYDLAASPRLVTRLERLSASVGAQLLVSQDALNAAGDKSKVAVLIGPTGIQGSYVKTRLVPFGEYIPLRSALGWLSGISKAAAQNMVPGAGAHVLHATLRSGQPLTIGVLICFESAFPDMARVDTDHGAQLIIYQTADSTFQGSWELAQHASLSAVRAAETGRPVVQAALTGDSVAFDARGRLLASAGPSRRGALVVSLALPPASARTLYDRLGDYVPWTAIVVLLAALLGLARGRPGRAARIRPHRPADIAWNGSREPDRTARLAGAPAEGPAADAEFGGGAAAQPRDGS